MTSEQSLDLLMEHDKDIGLMAQSIEHLAEAVGTTNKKLDDVIDVIAKQNILAERFMNLEEHIKESFKAMTTRVDKLEDMVTKDGCSVTKTQTEKLAMANRRIEKLEDTVSWVVKTIIGSLITGLIATLYYLARG